MSVVNTIDQLEKIYGAPGQASLVKVSNNISPAYARLIEASPFMALATCGPEGLDCSPRGEPGGVLRIQDERKPLMPDRRGNNRIDSLRNIVRDPRVALMCLIPGSGMTLRINGRAHLSVDQQLLASFSVEENAPRCVIVIEIEEIYFQCARAIDRASLWDPARHAAPQSLPSAGQILSEMSGQRIDAAAYDREWAERAKKSMW